MSKEQEKEEKDLQLAINKSDTVIDKLDSMNKFFLEKLKMDTHELKLLQSWYPGITAPELMYAVGFQNETGLSIAKKEIWLVKRGSYQTINGRKEWVEKYEPLVGIEGSRTIARKNCKSLDIPFIPANTGFEMKVVPIVKSEAGELIFSSGEMLVGFAEAEINGKLVRVEVPFIEACQWTKEKTDNSGNIIAHKRLTAFWEKNPLHMIQKTAEARFNKKVYGVSVSVEGDQLNGIEQVEIIPSGGIGVSALKQLGDIKNDFEETNVETVVESEITEPAEVVEPKQEVTGSEPSMDEKFKIKCEEYGITGEVLIKYFNEVKEIPVTDSSDIYTGEDFKQFRDNFVNTSANLNALKDIKKTM